MSVARDCGDCGDCALPCAQPSARQAPPTTTAIRTEGFECRPMGLADEEATDFERKENMGLLVREVALQARYHSAHRWCPFRGPAGHRVGVLAHARAKRRPNRKYDSEPPASSEGTFRFLRGGAPSHGDRGEIRVIHH